jgi:hypothetical protein
MGPGSDQETTYQDPSAVDDRWDELLQLIIQYGGERFTAGIEAYKTLMRGEWPVKTYASGIPSSDGLGKIIAELLRLQHEVGDD